MARIVLHAEPGWGSAIIEAQLAWYGLDFAVERTDDLFASAGARAALERLNPLAQIPTIVLADGTVMTESAAITLHLADIKGSTELVPSAGEPERAAFLRWLVFLVAAIYPTFTFADEPARFVPEASAREGFRRTVDVYAERLWRIVEEAAAEPFFLGERMSAIDLYIAVMSRWRPRRPWFAANAPRLHAIAGRVDALPRLAATWARNADADQA